MGLQQLADQRAHKQDGDGGRTDGHAAHEADQDGDQLRLTRGLAGVVQLAQHDVKHTAAGKHLQQGEHEEAEADDVQHAGEAGADGAGGVHHLGGLDEAEHQAQHEAHQVADDQSADEVPALEHQDDHDDGDHQHDQGLGVGGVHQLRQGHGLGALEAKSDNVPPLFRRYVFVGKEVKL